jgi:hypothetical protein
VGARSRIESAQGEEWKRGRIMTQAERHAAANKAFRETMLGADKLVALGFKKKGIIRMISFHVERRKSKYKTSLSLAAGLQALAGK